MKGPKMVNTGSQPAIPLPNNPQIIITGSQPHIPNRPQTFPMETDSECELDSKIGKQREKIENRN